MNKITTSVFCLAFFFLTGCAVGEISGDTFYLKNDFSVKLLNDDWQVVRQKNDPLNPAHKPSPFKISFAHKKSNGYIMADSFEMNEVSQTRSLRVHADDALARWRATKLSERETKIDGIDAIEVVMTNERLIKWVFLKKGQKAYVLMYVNTSHYFDEYLEVFDKFVETFKTL